jgi:hypothetical protein
MFAGILLHAGSGDLADSGWNLVTRVLSFPPMKHKPFRKPRIRKFGDVSRMTRSTFPGESQGQETQGRIIYDSI